MIHQKWALQPYIVIAKAYGKVEHESVEAHDPGDRAGGLSAELSGLVVGLKGTGTCSSSATCVA
jgi:hypothetical protein